MKNNDLEKSILSLNKAFDSNKENSNDLVVQFSNWKYKYKCMEQCVTEVKHLQEKITNHSNFRTITFKTFKYLILIIMKIVKILIQENDRLKIVQKYHNREKESINQEIIKLKAVIMNSCITEFI